MRSVYNFLFVWSLSGLVLILYSFLGRFSIPISYGGSKMQNPWVSINGSSWTRKGLKHFFFLCLTLCGTWVELKNLIPKKKKNGLNSIKPYKARSSQCYLIQSRAQEKKENQSHLWKIKKNLKCSHREPTTYLKIMYVYEVYFQGYKSFSIIGHQLLWLIILIKLGRKISSLPS